MLQARRELCVTVYHWRFESTGSDRPTIAGTENTAAAGRPPATDKKEKYYIRARRDARGGKEVEIVVR
jgi:hypothetical protein